MPDVLVSVVFTADVNAGHLSAQLEVLAQRLTPAVLPQALEQQQSSAML
jgi:hypothetical protein